MNPEISLDTGQARVRYIKQIPVFSEDTQSCQIMLFPGLNMKSSLQLKPCDLKDKNIFVVWSKEEREELFAMLLNKIKQQNFCNLICVDPSIISEVKTGKIKPSGHIYFSILEILGIAKKVEGLTLSGRSHRHIRIKYDLISPELIGLIHTDGHMNLTKKGTGVNFYFCNKNYFLTERFKALVSESFECDFLEYVDKRDGTKYVHPPSVLGRILAKKIGWKDKPSVNNLETEEIPEYLRGVFDGDGTITIGNNKNSGIFPKIKISSATLEYSLQLRDLLSQLGIYSKVSSETSKKGYRWNNTVLSRHKDILLFIDKIGSSHPVKKGKQEYVKKVLLNGNHVPSFQEVI